MEMVEKHSEYGKQFSSKRGASHQDRDARLYLEVEVAMGAKGSKAKACNEVHPGSVRLSPRTISNIHNKQDSGVYGDILKAVVKETRKPRNVIAADLIKELKLPLHD